MANQDIALSRIRTDGGTQIRVDLDPATIEDYAADMLGGDHFPPIVVFFDGADYWLADGFHRMEAAAKAKLDRIKADVRKGTCRDAVLFSVGANSGHGLRRTNEDKRRAVLTLLNDPEWAQWSDHEIGRRCQVSRPFVGKLRTELSSNGYQIPKERTASRGGTQYTVNTSKIGASPNGGEPRGSPDPAEAGESPDTPAPTPSPTVAGRNGKEYPARKPAEPRSEPETSETEEPEPEEEEEESPEEEDAEDQNIPQDAGEGKKHPAQLPKPKPDPTAAFERIFLDYCQIVRSVQRRGGLIRLMSHLTDINRRRGLKSLKDFHQELGAEIAKVERSIS